MRLFDPLICSFFGKGSLLPKISILAFGIGLIFITSCASDNSKDVPEFTYQFHVDEKGDSPNVGDLVFFHEKHFLNGNLIFTTEKAGQRNIILPAKENLTRPLPPNYEALFKMSKGDSITVTQQLNQHPAIPKGIVMNDTITYVIKLDSIISKANIPVENQPKVAKSKYGYPIEQKAIKGNFRVFPGDFIKYAESRYKNDSLIFRSPIDEPIEAMLPINDKVPVPPPANYEGLLLMGQGDSLHIFQPLAQVEGLPSYLKATDTIKYRLKLLEIKTPAEFFIEKKIAEATDEVEANKAKQRAVSISDATKVLIKKYKNGELEDDLIRTHSGLKYILHEEGKGSKTQPTREVTVHYSGFLMDGTIFDSSFQKGEPISFPLGMGRVIKGWDEAISKLNYGAKVTVFIPYKLAYGFRGRPPSIPEQADLVFYIEVLK